MARSTMVFSIPFAAQDSSEVLGFAMYSNAGGVPGVSLATLGAATSSNSDEGEYSANNLSNPVELLAGIQYWLVLKPGTDETSVTWEGAASSDRPIATTYDPSGMSGGQAQTPGPWEGQFEIDGTSAAASAPEPATLWLLIGGVGAFGLKRVWRSESMQRPGTQ